MASDFESSGTGNGTKIAAVAATVLGLAAMTWAYTRSHAPLQKYQQDGIEVVTNNAPYESHVGNTWTAKADLNNDGIVDYISGEPTRKATLAEPLATRKKEFGTTGETAVKIAYSCPKKAKKGETMPYDTLIFRVPYEFGQGTRLVISDGVHPDIALYEGNRRFVIYNESRNGKTTFRAAEYTFQ